MKNKIKSKHEVMIRLKNSTSPIDLSLKNGYVQIRNGVKMPNINSMMNDLFDFAIFLDSHDILINSLCNEDYRRACIESIEKIRANNEYI